MKAVQIVSEPGVRLAAELIVPADAKLPVPAVLLLGGGGPSPHGIYPLLEAKLHAKGIATLSFDKRGVGASTGTFIDAMTPMTDDARAALAYLKSRQNLIDTGRIAILGLSQGGVIAAALAAEDPTVAAIVTLAAPAGQRGTMFLDSMREKLMAAGMDRTASDRVVSATRIYLDALTTGGAPNAIRSLRVELVKAFVQGGWKRELAEGAVQTLSQPATSSLYTVAASDVLSKIRVPVLAMYAADDTVVSSALSIPEARRALSKNKDATIVKMPDVEHGFKPLSYTTEGKKEYRGWPISDAASLNLIDSWLPQHLLRTVK
ncbi:alpha/beta hydrolase [Sphingomonas sp. NPDC079357]|uniref:alpha/beta hydrolase n=1 Tax=Sphingomonas sp. NPDC079357 TaxID=3364518 RepID=UPI00384D6ADC